MHQKETIFERICILKDAAELYRDSIMEGPKVLGSLLYICIFPVKGGKLVSHNHAARTEHISVAEHAKKGKIGTLEKRTYEGIVAESDYPLDLRIFELP